MQDTVDSSAGQRLARREYFWDALRAGLMILGIPYHVCLSYMAGKQWIVRSDEGVAGFDGIAAFIHLFRMPAFYVICGYFAWKVLEKRDPGSWMKGRVRRLVPPFAATLVLLVPAMNWFCEISNLPFDRAVASWLDNSSKSGGYWVRHLWFIIVLLYLSAMSALVVRRKPSLAAARIEPERDAAMARRMPFTLLLLALAIGGWEAVAVEAFYDWGFATNFWQGILRIDQLIIFAPWFALGALLVRSPRLLEAFCRISLVMIAAAAVFTVLSLTAAKEVHPATGRLITSFAAMALTQVTVSLAKALLDRPSPLVRELVAASFVIYLFHLPLVCGLVWLGQDVPVPPLVKALGVMLLTLGLSWGAWRIIRRSDWLLLAFDGSTREEERKRRLAATPGGSLPNPPQAA
jgi:glucans biosynthesis protein C